MREVKQGENRQGCRFIDRDVIKFATETRQLRNLKDEAWVERVRQTLIKSFPDLKYCNDHQCYCDERNQ